MVAFDIHNAYPIIYSYPMDVNVGRVFNTKSKIGWCVKVSHLKI